MSLKINASNGIFHSSEHVRGSGITKTPNLQPFVGKAPMSQGFAKKSILISGFWSCREVNCFGWIQRVWRFVSDSFPKYCEIHHFFKFDKIYLIGLVHVSLWGMTPKCDDPSMVKRFCLLALMVSGWGYFVLVHWVCLALDKLSVTFRILWRCSHFPTGEIVVKHI